MAIPSANTFSKTENFKPTNLRKIILYTTIQHLAPYTRKLSKIELQTAAEVKERVELYL
jgi:hypothetical protein